MERAIDLRSPYPRFSRLTSRTCVARGITSFQSELASRYALSVQRVGLLLLPFLCRITFVSIAIFQVKVTQSKKLSVFP